MANNYIRGHQIGLALGDGATPTEVFTPMILLNSKRGFKFSASTETDEVADLSNPSAPATTYRTVSATDLTFDGEGKIDIDEIPAILEWIQSGEAKNVKLTGIGATLTGPVFCTSLTVNAEHYKLADVSLSFEQESAFTITN